VSDGREALIASALGLIIGLFISLLIIKIFSYRSHLKELYLKSKVKGRTAIILSQLSLAGLVLAIIISNKLVIQVCKINPTSINYIFTPEVMLLIGACVYLLKKCK
jgi:hypothetical protein